MNHSDSVTELPTVDFLIMTALKEEQSAVLRAAKRFAGKVDKLSVPDHPIYYYFELVNQIPTDNRYTVAIVSRPRDMGNLSALERASTAINDLHPKYILMVGIAGGVDEELSLGDVIVSREVWYYEPKKNLPDGSVQHRPQMLPVDQMLLNRAQNLDSNWWEQLEVPRPDGCQEPPFVMDGPYAVGESVVQDPEVARQLKNVIAKLAAIEMESAGVAYAAFSSVERPRFIAIRGISDFADERKQEQSAWRPRAAAAAAEFALQLITQGGHSRHEPLSPRTESKDSTKLIGLTHFSLYDGERSSVERSVAENWDEYDLTLLSIAQTDLCVNGRLLNIQKAVERQIDVAERISSITAEHSSADVVYFGLPHVPLAFLVGYQIPKQKLSFFEFERNEKYWYPLQDDATDFPTLKLTGAPSRVVEDSGEVVLRICTSYHINDEDVEAVIPSPLASLTLTLDPPELDLVKSQQQLVEYGKQFRHALDLIRKFLPNTSKVHVFYAGPVSLAVHLGQTISHTNDPKVVVYNYYKDDSPTYGWGITLASSFEEIEFIVASDVYDAGEKK